MKKADIANTVNLNEYERYYIPFSDLDSRLSDYPVIIVEIEDDDIYKYRVLIINPKTSNPIMAIECFTSEEAKDMIYTLIDSPKVALDVFIASSMQQLKESKDEDDQQLFNKIMDGYKASKKDFDKKLKEKSDKVMVIRDDRGELKFLN